MRINRLMLTLTIAGFTGPFTNWAYGQEATLLSPLAAQPASSVGRISDEPSTIGDSNLLSREVALTPDARPEEFRNNFVDPARSGTKISDDLRGSISDNSLSFATPAQLTSQEAMIEGELGDESSETIVEEEVIYVPTRTTRAFRASDDWWAETEALLWFARQSSSQPLVVTGPSGVRPTTELAGGSQPLGGSLAPGMRVNFGKWLDSDKTLGVGGRIFGLLDGDSTDTFSSNQFSELGVPVFDVFSGTPQEILIASNAGAFGSDTGFMSVESGTELISAEAYGRILLAKSADSRADVVAGYSFLRFDNSTILRTSSTDGIVNGTEDGTVTTTVDAFGAKNTFHGGHLGIMNEMRGGFVSLSTLTKIALGNMSTTTNVFGSTVENVPSTGIAPPLNNGLFTGPSLSGSQTRDRFSFIPEIGAKLKLDLTQRFQFSVGYTLIVLPDVGVASDLVNTTIDSSGFIGLPSTPGGVLRDQVSFIHGIDLGVTLKF